LLESDRKMNELDEIAFANKAHWEKAVKEGAGFTRPYLDLDVEAFRAYRERKTKNLPKPYGDNPVGRVVMKDVQGKDVLCLAAGGGQQSAVFSLLGARVTVLDLAEGQLEGDKKAAAHYGYEVTTIQGDMRDLSCLRDESFDLVYGTGMAFVPDVHEVYSGVARVLRVGDFYRVDFANPATEFVDCTDWDGKGYRITRPYAEKMRRRDDGAIEFRHHLCDIFNGLIAVGFYIQQVEDNWFYDRPNVEAESGSWRHWMAYTAGLAIVARKEKKAS